MSSIIVEHQKLNALKFIYDILKANIDADSDYINQNNLEEAVLDLCMKYMTQDVLDVILSAFGVTNYVIINSSSAYLLNGSINYNVKQVLEGFNIHIYNRFFGDYLIGGSMNVD